MTEESDALAKLQVLGFGTEPVETWDEVAKKAAEEKLQTLGLGTGTVETWDEVKS